MCTIEAAHAYLEAEFMPDWQQRFAVAPANTTDAQRAVTELHDLAASFSHMETRKVANDYTIQFQGQRYQIASTSVTVGMKGQNVRVELRLDGNIAVRFNGQYLSISAAMSKVPAQRMPVSSQPVRKDHNRGGRSRWMSDFCVQGCPAIVEGCPRFKPRRLKDNSERRANPARRTSHLRPTPLLGNSPP